MRSDCNIRREKDTRQLSGRRWRSPECHPDGRTPETRYRNEQSGEMLIFSSDSYAQHFHNQLLLILVDRLGRAATRAGQALPAGLVQGVLFGRITLLPAVRLTRSAAWRVRVTKHLHQRDSINSGNVCKLLTKLPADIHLCTT